MSPGKPFSESKLIHFDEFEIDLSAWMVKRNNARVPLQRKPFQILRMLLERPGELVSRAELARALWPDLHVDYDHCLNTAVNALRNALGDPTRQSRFIETHPGLGYRFRAAIKVTGAAEPNLDTGYYFLHRFSFDGISRARACFNAVVQHGHANISGHLALAELECLTAICGYVPTREAAGRALSHVRKAEAVDSELDEVQILLSISEGLLHSQAQGDAIAARLSARHQGTGGLTKLWLAHFLCAEGRIQEAITHLEAARLEHPFSILILSMLAFFSYLGDNYTEAVEHAWAALSLESANAPAQHALALAYLQLDHVEDAVTEFENACNSTPYNSAALAGLYHALQTSGRESEAGSVRAKLEEAARASYVSPCWRAIAERASGDRDAATQCLCEAEREGDALLGFARLDPRLRN